MNGIRGEGAKAKKMGTNGMGEKGVKVKRMGTHGTRKKVGGARGKRMKHQGKVQGKVQRKVAAGERSGIPARAGGCG
jgi:hypothetical protein